MFTLTFATDNASFDNPEDAKEEIGRCLMRVAESVEADATAGAVYDSNGNRIGEWRLG